MVLDKWSVTKCTYSFHSTCYAAGRQVGRKPNRFLLRRHGRVLWSRKGLRGEMVNLDSGVQPFHSSQIRGRGEEIERNGDLL